MLKSEFSPFQIYSYLHKFPDAVSMIAKVSKAVDYDINGAISFCLHFLEDVNAHKEMRYIEKGFEKGFEESEKD